MKKILKDKGVMGLVDEFMRLKDVIKRAKGLTDRARRYDRIASSIHAILNEVSDITDDPPEKVFVPGDRYSSGNTDRECWAKLYGETEKIAKEKQHKYFEEFTPGGYGTTVRFSDWVYDEANGGVYYYYIHLTRMHSCD